MNQHQIDDLRRAAERAGRGETCSVDAEDLLELLAELRFWRNSDEVEATAAFELQRDDLL